MLFIDELLKNSNTCITNNRRSMHIGEGIMTTFNVLERLNIPFYRATQLC